MLFTPVFSWFLEGLQLLTRLRRRRVIWWRIRMSYRDRSWSDFLLDIFLEHIDHTWDFGTDLLRRCGCVFALLFLMTVLIFSATHRVLGLLLSALAMLVLRSIVLVFRFTRGIWDRLFIILFLYSFLLSYKAFSFVSRRRFFFIRLFYILIFLCYILLYIFIHMFLLVFSLDILLIIWRTVIRRLIQLGARSEGESGFFEFFFHG